MDFLDPKKKRAHTIRLYVGYILIAMIIGLGTLLLWLQSYGYGVDRKTGEIIQNGLVFISAQPEAADIYLNNKLYKTQDNARLVLPADNYNLELKRNGYRTWKRSFTLEGGSIERYVYPFLYPTTLNTKDQQSYASAPAFSTQSPDRHWIVVQQPGQLAVFDVFDANDFEKPATNFTVPTGIFTASDKHALELVEWSTDNRHILVKHTYSTGFEFVMIDREEPASSVNLNKVFTRNPTQITMRDKKFDRLYLFDQMTGKLDFGTVKDAALKPVLSGVLAYKSHGDETIIYATNQSAPTGKTRIMIRDNDGSYNLRDITADNRYVLDLATFDGRWYMLAGSPIDNKVYIYRDPLAVLKHQTSIPLVPIGLLRVDQPFKISFSANARFMMAEGSNLSTFAVFDAETGRTYRYQIPVALDAGTYATWMDGHRLLVTSQNKLVVFDYDGINLHTLSPNYAGQLAFFDRDYKLLYNLAPSTSEPSRAALTRTNLKVLPPGQNK